MLPPTPRPWRSHTPQRASRRRLRLRASARRRYAARQHEARRTPRMLVPRQHRLCSVPDAPSRADTPLSSPPPTRHRLQRERVIRCAAMPLHRRRRRLSPLRYAERRGGGRLFIRFAPTVIANACPEIRSASRAEGFRPSPRRQPRRGRTRFAAAAASPHRGGAERLKASRPRRPALRLRATSVALLCKAYRLYACVLVTPPYRRIYAHAAASVIPAARFCYGAYAAQACDS